MATTAAVTTPRISVAEYLNTDYRPDVDYVDGELEERNVGEFDHADLQLSLLRILDPLRAQGFRCTQETRLQITETRYRVPDVCLLPHAWKRTQILRVAPLLCAEVLSPRDRLAAMQRRCQDYISLGVPHIWILDPRKRLAYVLNAKDIQPVSDGVLGIPEASFAVDVKQLFAVLDEA